ncbi:hypothetical protein ACWEKT_37485 [Nocardia takedensis]
MVRARALAAGYSDEQAAAFRGHSLRAGATTQALDNGASYREVMNLTGHTQIDTVRGYDRAPTHRANATRKLGLMTQLPDLSGLSGEYRRQWREFTTFAAVTDTTALPAATDTVLAYLHEHHGAALGSQRARLAAINAVHRAAGQPEPGHAEPLRRLLNPARGPRSARAADRVHVGVHHGRREHMGLYLARGTRAQLDLLTAALATMTTAETTPSAQRLPAMGEVADFVAAWCDQDETDDLDAALSAWRTVVQILALAVADTPDDPTRRPDRDGVLHPVPADETPAADTRVLLGLVDAVDGRSIELDEQGWAAWRRLCAEWHVAIYGPDSRGADGLLASFTY